jgi:hypothetical protein
MRYLLSSKESSLHLEIREGFSMLSRRSSSVSVFTSKPILARVIIAGALVLAMVAPSWGQAPSPKPGPNTEKVHWHKYVNKEFGFSLRYPDTYRPMDGNEICKDNDYRRCLLCLERRDDSESLMVVTIVIAEPFHVYPFHADIMPARQRIGHYVFYCGMAGSMAVGYADSCIFNLKGKTLEFEFSPTETLNSGKKTNSLASEVLQTFRTL